MEVLLAIGVLAIGLLFVAGTFPVGIFLTTSATEQTIAPLVADEAFAKIRIYSLPDPNSQLDSTVSTGLRFDRIWFDTDDSGYGSYIHRNFVLDFNDTDSQGIIDHKKRAFITSEQLYPSMPSTKESFYQWSALIKEAQKNTANTNVPVLITVFVSHKTGQSLKYPDPADILNNVIPWPQPLNIPVADVTGRKREIQITDADLKQYINADCTIVEDIRGEIYRILDRNDDIVTLDKDWQGGDPVGSDSTVWVIPQAIGGSKSPCIGVYQRIMKIK